MTPAEKVQLADALCRKHFSAFAQRAFAVYAPAESLEYNWHIDCISEHLEAVRAGELRRLIINIPPRALKSYLVSICFPAWVLGKEPHEKIMCASHTMRPLAAKLSNDFRRIIDSDWYKRVFPATRVQKSTEFETYTTQNGHRLAFGMNSPTGLGCNYGIIDDLNKPDEALSDTIRQSTNDWVDNTFMSRFNDYRTGRAVIVQQRVHSDDLTGHLLKKGGWTHLKLPAEGKRTIVTLGDKVFTQPHQDLLFPERLPREVLDEKRNDLGNYNYAGQYLQEPAPLGGGVLKIKDVQFFDSAIASTMNVFILVDPAGVETPDGKTKREKKTDWSCFAVVGLGNDGNRYLLDVIRDKLNPSDRIDTLFRLHRKWSAECGKPIKVGYERYGMMSDVHYIKDRQNKDNYRFPIVELGGKMSKVDRIMRMEPDLVGGRWWWLKSKIYADSMGRTLDLVPDILNAEMATFPFSQHDDCLDAISRIYDDELSAQFPLIPRRASQTQESSDWRDF